MSSSWNDEKNPPNPPQPPTSVKSEVMSEMLVKTYTVKDIMASRERIAFLYPFDHSWGLSASPLGSNSTLGSLIVGARGADI